MSWWVALILLILCIAGINVSYRIANIKNNKRILIATYAFSLFSLIVLSYITLDIIFVGGI